MGLDMGSDVGGRLDNIWMNNEDRGFGVTWLYSNVMEYVESV